MTYKQQEGQAMSIVMETSQKQAEQEFVVSQLKNYRDEATNQMEQCKRKMSQILGQVSAGNHNEVLDISFKELQKKWKIASDHVTSLENTILHESLKLAHIEGELK
jgi:hypothetical protein